MMGSVVCVLLVVMSLVFFEADANMQSFRLESKSVVRNRRSLLSDAEKSEVVKAHNDLRRLEGSSNMEMMRWNDDLAEMAEAWAEQCIEGHNDSFLHLPSSLGNGSAGQNFYATTAQSINMTGITLIWYNEKGDYKYGTGDRSVITGSCGHYTQVVWATSNMIGCGYSRCETLANANQPFMKAIVVVCNYAPPGNVGNQKPFKKGPACTECTSNSYSCNGGLCDGYAFLEAGMNMQSPRLKYRSVGRKKRCIFNLDQKAEVVKAHNDVRRLEKASNMEIMVWDEDLAKKAEDDVLHCHYEGLNNKPRNAILLFASGGINITKVTLTWYSEKFKYNYGKADCTEPHMCDNYTQIVWATTNKIGCAYEYCEVYFDTKFPPLSAVFCFYDPPGNHEGERPFKMGTPCSECANNSKWCNGGLCDESCSIGKPGCECTLPACQNSGTSNSDSISCECACCGTNCTSVYCAAVDDKSLTMTAKLTVTLSLTILWLFSV